MIEKRSRSEASFRQRVYEYYHSATGVNSYSPFAMTLEAKVRQYRKRWRRFLPADKCAPILDIGCGSGEFLCFLQQEGYTNIQGIDRSPEQVEVARRIGLKQVEVADAFSYLASCSRSYQLLNAQNVLEHLTKDELFMLLDAIVASLKPGGLLFTVVPNAKSLFGARVRYGDITHELSFTPESLVQICTIVGLKPAIIREHGPVVHGAKSAVRWAVWQVIRAGLLLALVAEVADRHFRVYTQDMMLVAKKP